MTEIAAYLSAVAVTFTGVPVTVNCVPQREWINPNIGAYVVYGPPDQVFMQRIDCRELRKPQPWFWSLEVFTHELIHVRFPYVKHGRQMQRAIARFKPQVCRLLKVRCTKPPKPDPYREQ